MLNCRIPVQPDLPAYGNLSFIMLSQLLYCIRINSPRVGMDELILVNLEDPVRWLSRTVLDI